MEMDRDEAMARIRAEIIASDWRLNRRRSEALRAALTVLAADAGGRPSFRYLLEMAGAAMTYQEKRGETAPPMVLDFLKQALAWVIAVAEDEQLAPEREAEIFNKVHLAFLALKRRLAANAARAG